MWLKPDWIGVCLEAFGHHLELIWMLFGVDWIAFGIVWMRLDCFWIMAVADNSSHFNRSRQLIYRMNQKNIFSQQS